MKRTWEGGGGAKPLSHLRAFDPRLAQPPFRRPVSRGLSWRRHSARRKFAHRRAKLAAPRPNPGTSPGRGQREEGSRLGGWSNTHTHTHPSPLGRVKDPSPTGCPPAAPGSGHPHSHPRLLRSSPPPAFGGLKIPPKQSQVVLPAPFWVGVGAILLSHCALPSNKVARPSPGRSPALSPPPTRVLGDFLWIFSRLS